MAEKMRQASEQPYAGQAPIVAVSWSPVTNSYWPAGGLWMSFYAVSGLHEQDVFTNPKVLTWAPGVAAAADGRQRGVSGVVARRLSR
ncbi:hypothetical protein AB0E12_23705 [Micromonospora chersina]|uniref:hypothetical protein n=1 Tax=Micromonospora chersina TaxID=47854 RepID=UPI0033E572F1